MNPKFAKAAVALNQLFAFAFVALATWKGPHVAGLVFVGLAGVCQLAAVLVALGVLPQKDSDYIALLEAAVERHAPEDVAKEIIKE